MTAFHTKVDLDALMNAYDMSAGGLFGIRSDSPAHKRVQLLCVAESIFSSYLAERRTKGELSMPHAVQALNGYTLWAERFRKHVEAHAAQSIQMTLFCDAARAAISYFSEFVQAIVIEDPDHELWLAPAFTHLTCLAATARKHTLLPMSDWEQSSMAAVFAASMQRGVELGLSDVKEHAERTIRQTWSAEAILGKDRDFTQQLFGRLLGGVAPAEVHERLKEVRVIRRKAEYVKKLSLELETRQ